MNFILPIAAGVPLDATSIGGDGFFSWLTNSIFVAALVTVIITFLARRATAKMELIPTGSQNLFEALVEGLYSMLEGIVGHHMIKKCFGFLATLFIYILVANWIGLLPGVGSIGWGEAKDDVLPLSVDHVDSPIFRPATADLNMTLGLAAIAMVLWFIWTIKEVGFGGFIHHLFAPKGGMTGLAGLAMAGIFFFVGILELISIATRPVSLSLRLFGNIFAGENILTMMIGLGHQFPAIPQWGAFILGIAVSIPFFLLEVMVGALQAFVFMLLCAVYIQLSTSHEEEAH